ncbi:co-chaperone YbbN [Streptomyces sp. WAC06614]|uniref:thioredoxin family protein n=1 Tax=Streptomyces sp. WAC06614 TaxID=2487416 RepID=UPI000F797625|nr:thioredoxin family protein [Streptomyces sp. WAC06614]RSS82898.1 thioredoxin [Streptomyces sp. WAC06614]
MRAQGVPEVTDATFAAEVLAERDRPVLVEFTADWCGPCRQLAPVLSALAADQADRLKIVQIDVDHNPEVTLRHGVLSAPTMIVFQGGEPVRSMVGTRTKHRLLAELEEILPVRA